jgi:hypothetical protein
VDQEEDHAPSHRRVPAMVMIFPRMDLCLALSDILLPKRLRGSLTIFFSSLFHLLQVLRMKAPKRTIAIAQIFTPLRNPFALLAKQSEH